MGPVIVLLVLLGVGYAVDLQDHSNPQHLTIKALSVKFVNNQGARNISNWNMTVKNNGTIPLIMGHLCQRNLDNNNCDDLAPSGSGSSMVSYGREHIVVHTNWCKHNLCKMGITRSNFRVAAQ